MDSRFAHLYKRDSSVSMIRVKMSRRRSQTQKENRERLQNLRRDLGQLPELELSMDVSALEKSVVPAPETGPNAKADKGNSAVEERKKMLARFKENKALQKEKERREKEKKGTFKVGLYRPQPLGYLPSNPVVPSTHKAAETVQMTRVTRSMKQQQQQPKMQSGRQTAAKKADLAPNTRSTKPSSAPVNSRSRTAAGEPTVRAPITRSAAKAVVTAGTTKAAPKTAAEVKAPKTKVANKQPAAPPTGRGRTTNGNSEPIPADLMETKPAEGEPPTGTSSPSPAERQRMDEPKVSPVSFAPQGFVFQAPVGLSTFKPAPLSPRSADSFLSPSFSLEPKIESPVPVSPKSDSSSAPLPPASPSLSPSPSPPKTPSPPVAASNLPLPTSASPPAPAPLPSPSASDSAEPQHDVPYFRAVMASETERLTGLCGLWEQRFEEPSIPEEMRDRMRTAVGQASLLMKERFDQFGGLVDDCDLGRGEKVTTCSDLQGFWDMVYFQVEDVNKKFNALKEAESRGWQEEVVPVARQRKVVKKFPVAGGKAGVGPGASAAAKSRLAAVKAAMKAKKAAAEKADPAQDKPALAHPVAAQIVVFDGGFFQVESPVKVMGAVRKSSRLSMAALGPQVSPHGSKYSTPSRKQRPTPASRLSPVCTPERPADPRPFSPGPLHFSPERTEPELSAQPCPTQSDRISESNEDRAQETVCPEVDGVVPVTEASPIRAQTSLIRSPSPSTASQSVENMETCACVTSTTPQHAHVPSPPRPDITDSRLDERSPMNVRPEVTENTEMENVASLDFERYLQPSARFSVSPAGERFSLGLADAEMESPVSHTEESAHDVLMTPTAPPTMAPLVTPWTELTNGRLVFTPELRDRVRQSVCERDLMMFTPPKSK